MNKHISVNRIFLYGSSHDADLPLLKFLCNKSNDHATHMFVTPKRPKLADVKSETLVEPLLIVIQHTSLNVFQLFIISWSAINLRLRNVY